MLKEFVRGGFCGFKGLDTHAFTPPVASAKALPRGLARKVNLSAKLRGGTYAMASIAPLTNSGKNIIFVYDFDAINII